MRVAIEVSALKTGHKFRGVGFYIKRLVQALQKVDKKNKYVLIENSKTPNLQKSKFDLVHYPYFDLFFLTLPIKKLAPTVVTIHDVIPLVFPEKYPKGIRGWFKFQIQKFSLKSVKTVITDSQNSKRDISKYLNFQREKIFVAPLAPGEEFKKLVIGHWSLVIKEKYQLPDTFVLYVGDVNWNKNVLGLIKAFKKLQSFQTHAAGKTFGDARPKLQLVMVGKAFEDKNLPETKAILRLIEELNLNNRIKILGFVPTKDLVGIYNLASVYCQPSFYEGFCLPVLEAMACGTPVVCSSKSSLPEIIGDAAILIDPNDYSSLAQGIKKVLEEKGLAKKLQVKGLTQARQFTWRKIAIKTIKVYRRVAEK